MLLTNGGFACTATLVAPNLVITARHCVASDLDETNPCGPVRADLPASAFSVAMGGSATSANAVGHGVKVFTESTTNLCGFDVALVQLDKDIVGARVARVRFDALAKGTDVTAVGYGSTRTGEVEAPSRMQRSTKVVAVGPSSQQWTPASGDPIAFEVPAGDLATGESTCFGDSGGPLYDQNGDLVAVTSRGIDGECSDRPSIFATLAAHETLIRDAAKGAGHELDTDATGSDPPADESDPGVDSEGTAHRATGQARAAASTGCAATPSPATSPSALALFLVLFGTIAVSFRRRS